MNGLHPTFGDPIKTVPKRGELTSRETESKPDPVFAQVIPNFVKGMSAPSIDVLVGR